MKFQLKRADGTVITPGDCAGLAHAGQGLGRPPPPSTSRVYAVVGDERRHLPARRRPVDLQLEHQGLAAGFYYRIGVKLDDGQTYYVNIGLR